MKFVVGVLLIFAITIPCAFFGVYLHDRKTKRDIKTSREWITEEDYENMQ